MKSPTAYRNLGHDGNTKRGDSQCPAHCPIFLRFSTICASQNSTTPPAILCSALLSWNRKSPPTAYFNVPNLWTPPSKHSPRYNTGMRGYSKMPSTNPRCAQQLALNQEKPRFAMPMTFWLKRTDYADSRPRGV